jgi:SP family facilitated glucose transporter-like MFS transporter 8
MTSFTVNPQTSQKRLPQYIAALAATGGALAAGTALGWTSPAGPELQNCTQDCSYDFIASDEEFSWIGSSMNLGAAAICIPIGYLANLFGRKLSMLGLVIPFTIGWACVIWAPNVATMIVGRVFLGLSGGAFCVTAPMYIGEISSKEIRGTLGSFFQLMITIGILFVYGVGAGVNVFVLSIICGVIPLIFGAVFLFMPESPTYLVIKDRSDDARTSLKWLRGADYDPTEEIAELENEKEERRAMNLSFREAFSRRSTIRACIISFGLMFFQQMSGINAVIFYTTDIFSAAQTELQPETQTIIVGVMQVVATLVSTLVVDYWGRRKLLLVSDSVMAVCTIALGVYFYLLEIGDPAAKNLAWLPVTCLCVFIITFSLGFGPVPWLMLGELFAPDVKALAGSLSGTLNWMLAFLVTKIFKNLVDGLNRSGTFWLFSGFSIIGTIFVFFIVIETKGKSLSQIQDELSGRKHDEPVESTNVEKQEKYDM